MLVTLGDPRLDHALGDSIIYEENRGDFAEANRLAEENLARARAKQDMEQIADALVARGVTHLLSFDLRSAESCFTEADRLDSREAARALRIRSLLNLTNHLQFNFAPTQAGIWTFELDIRWDRLAATGKFDRERSHLETGISLPAQFAESRLVNDLISGLLAPGNILGESDAQSGAISHVLGTVLRQIQAFQQIAQQANPADSSIAYAFWAMANLCRCARKGPELAQLLQMTNQAYTELGDRIGMANCRMLWGDWLAAPFSHPAAWDLAIRDSGTQGSDLAWTVEAQEMRADGAAAEAAQEIYLQAEAHYQEAGAIRGLAAIAVRRTYLSALAGKFDEAITHAGRANSMFEKSGDWLGYWTAQTHRMLAQLGAGIFPEDIETARAIGLWGAGEGSFSYALGLGILIGRAGRVWLLRKGSHERTLACYRLAKEVYDALGCASNSAQCLTDFAVVHQALGSVSVAMNWYEQAIDQYDRAAATTPVMAGNLRGRQISIACDMFQLALRVMDVDAMEASAARLEGLARYLPEEGTLLAQAIETVQRMEAQLQSGTVSADIPTEVVERFVLRRFCDSLLLQAKVYVPLYRATRARNAGDHQAADAFFTSALDAASSGGAEADQMRATVLATQHKYPEAIEAFQHFVSTGGVAYGFIGDLMRIMGAGGTERGEAEQKKQEERNHELAFTFYVRSKAYDDAKRELDQLIAMSGEEWWQGQQRPWSSLETCAELYEYLNQLEAAIEYHNQAIKIYEEQRAELTRDDFKTSLGGESSSQDMFFRAARTAVKLRQAAEERGNQGGLRLYSSLAFDYAERGKARALLDLMAATHNLRNLPADKSHAMRRWRELTQQLAMLQELARLRQRRASGQAGAPNDAQEELTAACEKELRGVEKELAANEPRFYGLINPQSSLLDLESIARMLPDGSIMLQYLFLEDSLLGWAIDRSGMLESKIVQTDTKSLARDAAAFRRLSAAGDPVEECATKLADTLLRPLAQCIEKSSRLIIVPYGALHLVPFHLLPWRDAPLMAERVISYLPSANALQFVSDHPATGSASRLLAIGNPANMASTTPDAVEPVPQPPLRWAAIEAEYVASEFFRDHALVGPAATKTEIMGQLPKCDVAHFATHGVLWEKAPLASAILLANGESLSIYELIGLDLHAALIVLSACDSGRGETTAGDDVLGLARGVLAAGARAALVSLWPVDDFSTCLLMGKFYERWQSHGDAALALREAEDYVRSCTDGQIEVARQGLSARFGEVEVRPSPAGAVEASSSFSRHFYDRAAVAQSNDYHQSRFWAPFILMGC